MPKKHLLIFFVIGSLGDPTVLAAGRSCEYNFMSVREQITADLVLYFQGGGLSEASARLLDSQVSQLLEQKSVHGNALFSGSKDQARKAILATLESRKIAPEFVLDLIQKSLLLNNQQGIRYTAASRATGESYQFFRYPDLSVALLSLVKQKAVLVPDIDISQFKAPPVPLLEVDLRRAIPVIQKYTGHIFAGWLKVGSLSELLERKARELHLEIEMMTSWSFAGREVVFEVAGDKERVEAFKAYLDQLKEAML